MKGLLKSKLALSLTTAVVLVALAVTPFFLMKWDTAKAAPNQSAAPAKNPCVNHAPMCPDVWDSEKVYGEGNYVGHDEPSLLFYSNTPGSGNRMQYNMILPRDAPDMDHPGPGVSTNFMLHIAFWFGMAMCDTQSYPLQVKTCTPDSDNNIVDPQVSAKHPGTAFMELQFYPPGWVKWPGGTSCDAHSYCAALNVDSLSINPVTGEQLNDTCAAKTGLEPVNFAFVTKSGVPQPNSPPNPVQSTLNTFTVNPATTFFMNPGDNIQVTLYDTAHGLQVILNDLTTHKSGSMTASAKNGFGQVKFAPNPSTECTNIPYDFHPMYSTSSEKTRVPWAAHSYNIAFSDEIGHFDRCDGPNAIPQSLFGVQCPQGNKESDGEATDADDNFCFPASMSSDVKINGCLGTNSGFDGTSYQKLWPDGSKKHGSPIILSSPRTGQNYNVNYNRMAFEADLPAVEPTCNIVTTAGCTRIPVTDDGAPATFYPFYATADVGNDQCMWTFGNDIPGLTKNDFGKSNEWGNLLKLFYTSGNSSVGLFPDFRQVLGKNPCPAGVDVF